MHWHIGTSGWVYPHWRNRFYPPELPKAQWLAYYARHFDCVEINRSFYRLPTQAQCVAWHSQVPTSFSFAVKASRYITHMKKLKDPTKTIPPLAESIAGLGEMQGPVLFQLPPHWRPDVARLRDFLVGVPKAWRVAFEMRDPRWHIDAVLEVLRDFNTAFCMFDLAGAQSMRVVTADFAYVRLHGPGGPYQGRYGLAALNEWADWLSSQTNRTTYVFFDNDESAYAIDDASKLRAIIKKM